MLNTFPEQEDSHLWIDLIKRKSEGEVACVASGDAPSIVIEAVQFGYSARETVIILIVVTIMLIIITMIIIAITIRLTIITTLSLRASRRPGPRVHCSLLEGF